MGDSMLNKLNLEGTYVARPPPFDGSNYNYWKRRMQFYFQGISWELWRMMSTPYELPETENATWDINMVKQAQLNAKAVSILYCSISVSEFNIISSCETAYDIWHRLSITHERTIQVKNSKISMLKQKFEQFLMEQNESISEMYARFSTIINGLSALGKFISEEDQVSKILRCLPPKYKPKVTAIEEANDLTRLRMEQFIGNLETHEVTLEEEERLAAEHKKEKRKDIAFKATTKISHDTSEEDSEEETLIVNGKQYRRSKTNKISSVSSSSSPRCFECGKKGHLKSDCPKLKKGKKSSHKKEKAYKAAWDDSSDNSEDGEEEVECLFAITNEEENESEFIAECFMRRAYLTGFTGSAGTAVVTKENAALWTDGRYFLQAEKQLSQGWTLMRSGSHGVPTSTEWLNDGLDPGCRVGIDPFLFSFDAAEDLKNSLSKKNHELVYMSDFNLVDEIWKDSKPNPPDGPIRLHPIKYSGVDVTSKLWSLRQEISEAGCTGIVLSMLDEIAWLLNLRGNDVPHSPVFYAYLVVEKDSAKLFVDQKKLTKEVKAHLSSSGVQWSPYEMILSEIESLAEKGAILWLDTSSVNAAVVNTFQAAFDRYFRSAANSKVDSYATEVDNHEYKSIDIHTGGPAPFFRVSPISMFKAIKNVNELDGMRSCHLRDAASICQFWAWLEEEIQDNARLTEVDVADRLLAFRSKQDGFIDTSFDTISGYGPNGAVIHYRPEPESCSIVDRNNLFLLDSGAQYVDGTTDITRTVHFGEPTPRQKECFTRVLQGHIALDEAVFPYGTPGFVLDVLARKSLWKIGLDYRHGTGHGVGAALNVHEGPQSISFRFGNMTPLQRGMIVSNEPGYYEDHSFGIRIENLLYVEEAETPNCYGGVTYLGFQKLTFVPIQCKLLDLSLMSADEIHWINNYHSQVWEKVSPLVDGAARKWLWNNTQPINKP